MKLRPVNDKIVIKPKADVDENITEGGIILPDMIDDGILLEGEVVAVGSGMYSTTGNLIPVVCSVGDTIIYNKHAAKQEYKLNGEMLLILSQNEILSILEDY
ncbi:MAG: co-chaperone GroES [Candidatus Pelagibacter sp.]|nr:co-chaperone GroES [Candidatus Pelagibacter sp.]